MPLAAQGWDAAAQAQGWARQDKDDSFTFYDAATKSLNTWMRDGGLMHSLSLLKLNATPDRWIIDPRNNAWVITGTTLTPVDTTGRLGASIKLPAEVADVCWDTKGFVLSYRTQEPYLEKRNYKGGDILWTFGSKPTRNEGFTPQNFHPITLDDSDHVLLGDGSGFNLSILNADTGKKIVETALVLGGAPAPGLSGTVDRGPICIWSGKGVAFASLRASDVPTSLRGDLQGLVLARIDISRSSLELLPTGLQPDHLLIGILESDAVFVGPKGGLMLVKIR